jgi:hypothetical protein
MVTASETGAASTALDKSVVLIVFDTLCPIFLSSCVNVRLPYRIDTSKNSISFSKIVSTRGSRLEESCDLLSDGGGRSGEPAGVPWGVVGALRDT